MFMKAAPVLLSRGGSFFGENDTADSSDFRAWKSAIVFRNASWQERSLKQYRVAILVAVLALLAGCKDIEVPRDMARFDRALIPALMLTSDEDTSGEAVMAVKGLKMELFTLKSRHSKAGWDAEIDEAEALVVKADWEVSGGEHEVAHDSLRRLREVMYELRKSEGIDYFPDYLTEYEFSIQRVEEIMAGRTPAGLSAIDMARVRREASLMRERWGNVLNAEFDPRVFGFTPRQVEKLNTRLKSQTNALADFEGALSDGDGRAVIEKFGDVKSRLAEVERLFGNFEFVRLQ
jgi:hypothetical protein